MVQAKEKYSRKSFRGIISQFSENLLALRDFVDLIEPTLSQRFQSDIESNAQKLLPFLVAFSEIGLLPELSPEKERKIREAFGADFTVEKTGDEEEGKKGVSLTVAPDVSKEFSRAVSRVFFHQNRRIHLLYDNALVSLFSAAEWFVAQLLHVYFRANPGTLGLKEKFFSLADLEAFDSLEDAMSYLIDFRVEAIMRGSIEEWFGTLKTKVDLSMGYLEPHREQLVEISQRRNIIVHNGGVVNSIYLSRVVPRLREGTAVGEPIDVSRSYLEQSISLVERTFILIGAELWKKFAPGDESRANVLTEITFDHLLAERWEVAESLSYFARGDKSIPEYSRMVATVNYWQAIKWQDRFEDVRSEIEEADFSAKDELFQLAKVVLLDNFDASLPLVRQAFSHGKLTVDDLKTWPLFRKLRDDPRFSEILGDPELAGLRGHEVRDSLFSTPE